MTWNVKDTELKTVDEITSRMRSINERIEKEENRKTRSNHIDCWRKKHERLTKLNARYEALHTRRAKLLQNTNKEPNNRLNA